MHELPSLVNLLKVLQQVPYLASKNMYRVASHFLRMDQYQLEQFCILLIAAKNNLTQCAVCFYWQERDSSCIFCTASKRDRLQVCVVEAWYDVLFIEKTQGYKGVYHVLGGIICPLEGIGPEDLTIEQLVQRAQGGVTEIILALNQTPEGEATAAYIAHCLQSTSVVITCLARGLPVGSSLGSMDRVTIHKALTERRRF